MASRAHRGPFATGSGRFVIEGGGPRWLYLFVLLLVWNASKRAQAVGAKMHDGDRTDLDYSLDLLEHVAEVYARCDGESRRLCNRAFLTANYIDEDNDVRVGYTTPFDPLTDWELQANALAWAQDARDESTAGTPTGSTVGR